MKVVHPVEDLRISASKVLLPPAFLEEEIPTTGHAAKIALETRAEISKLLRGKDQRVLTIVGPCSIHDIHAAREYATLLMKARREFAAELCVVMRVYFEKPRTTTGWKGLINDPDLDGSFKINDGLRKHQGAVCRAIIEQIKSGEQRIVGVMLESNIGEGAQILTPGIPLVYGQSITDACIGWDETLEILRELASAVRTTRIRRVVSAR